MTFGIAWGVFLFFQLNNPLWPEARPWDSLLLTALALALTWLGPDRLLRPQRAVTTVIPSPPAAAPPKPLFD